MQRFLRNRLLLGDEKFNTLQNSIVIVFGLGAVGGYAVEALARLGVGSLTLVDFDTVDITNINRQILALDSTVGQAKAKLAFQRISDINPECHIVIKQEYLQKNNLKDIIDEDYDLIVDAIDSVGPKLDLLEYAYKNNLTIVSSMGAAMRTDPSRVFDGDIFDSSGCPLAKRVRTELRKRDVGRGISCIYSTEPVFIKPEKSEKSEIDDIYPGRQRNIMGSLATLTGIFGLRLAHLAMNKIFEKSSIDS